MQLAYIKFLEVLSEIRMTTLELLVCLKPLGKLTKTLGSHSYELRTSLR